MPSLCQLLAAEFPEHLLTGVDVTLLIGVVFDDAFNCTTFAALLNVCYRSYIALS